MKWRRAPVLCLLLLPACSLLVQNEEFFDGASKNGGAAGLADSAAGDSSVAGGVSSADAGASASDSMGGAGDADSAGGASGASGDSSSGGTSGSSGGNISAGGGAAPACDKPICTPNMVYSEKQTCCSTGQQTHTHVCSADGCSFGAWSTWGACSVAATCVPGTTEACANKDSCGQRVCSASCAWGACAPKTADGCLRIGPDHTDEGSNYKCCGSGKWTFCLSTCKWSTTCEACTDCGC